MATRSSTPNAPIAGSGDETPSTAAAQNADRRTVADMRRGSRRGGHGLRRCLRRLVHGGEHGQGVVEIAIALPIFLIVVCAIVEFGLLLSDQIRLTNAARAAAQAGAIHVEQSHASIADADRVALATAAGNAAAGSLLGCVSATPDVDPQTGATPATITVSISCAYTPVTPLGKLIRIAHGSFVLPTTLRSSATVDIEP